MGMPRHKTKSDLERHAGLVRHDGEQPDPKKGFTYLGLTNQLAEERLKRLKHQNRKLSLDVRKIEGEMVSLAEMKRVVLAANVVVKQQILAVPPRIALPLGLTREQVLGMTSALIDALNDLQ